MSWSCLLAALLLLVAATPGVLPLAALQRPGASRAHWLALVALGALALAAAGGGHGAPQGQLALIALAVAAGALLATAGTEGPQLGRSVGLGAAAACAVAAAFALPPELVVAASAAPGASLLLIQLLTAGLAVGGLLVVVVAQWPVAGLDRRSTRIIAPAMSLLLLALLPGLARWTVGGGFGMLPQRAGLPVLALVAAGPSSGMGGQTILATDVHSLPLRVPVPAANMMLAAAALALAVALVLALLPAVSGGGLPSPGAGAGAAGGRRSQVALVVAGGLLLLTAGALALALLPAGPEPAVADVNRWLALRFADSHPASWQVRLQPGATLQGAGGPLGAGLDLGALALAGLLSLGVALGRDPGAATPDSGRPGAGLTSLTLSLVAAALLVGVFASQRLVGLPWVADPRNLALALALGCIAWARFAAPGPRARLGLLLGALALLGLALLGAGRGSLAPTLFDALSVT